MDINKKKEMNSDIDNWVMVNSCDIAEEAITLNRTTDSDHESESSISIISSVSTPNECHSEDEPVPNNEKLNEEEGSLSTSTRSSVEKIEISDEENYISESCLSQLLPLIKITEVIESPLIVKDNLDEQQNLEIGNSDDDNYEAVKIKQVESIMTFSIENQEEKIGERPPRMICPRIIIQSVDKIIDSIDDDDILPSTPQNVEEKEIENRESLKKLLEESIMDIQDFRNEYQPMQYDRPPIIDDSDSWTDNDSSSDYMTQDTQIVTSSDPHPNRQEGITALFSQNGLFIGAMFFFATALLKLYLLNENASLTDQNAFDYELNKLKEQYQSVDMHYNSHVDAPKDSNLKTIVQYCIAKHGSNEDPYHRNNQRVERCINKRTKKINIEKDTKKKKMTLDIREKLLEIRERGLQKREQELIDKLTEIHERDANNIKSDAISANTVYQVSEKQHYKSDRDYFKELRKRIHEGPENPIKFKKKQKIDEEKFDRIQTKYFPKTGDKKYEDIGKHYKADDDFLLITETNNPINDLTEKIYNTDISDYTDKDVVTFKEIALALREKELDRKLQEYNDNLENMINNIAILNRPNQVSKREKKDSANVKEKINFKKDKRISHTKTKRENGKDYAKQEKFENKRTKFNTKEKEDLSKERQKYNNIKRKIFEDQKTYNKKVKYSSKENKDKIIKDTKQGFKMDSKYFDSLNLKGSNGRKKINSEENYFKKVNNKLKSNHKKVNEQHNQQPIIVDPTQEFKNKKHNIMKNFNKFRKNKDYRKKDPKDELYIKYNPIKDTIDIVNISNSEDKNFILLVNGNKTVNGQWYINLHHARNMLRSKEKSADWYFDRVLYRELKRNKARWYFDYMSGRQNTRDCFI